MSNPKVRRRPELLPAEEDDFAGAVLDGLSKPQQDLALPLLLRRARQRAVRGDHAPAGVLSDAHGGRDSRGARRRDRRRRAGRRRAGRVRLRLQPEDRDPAPAAAAARRLRLDRRVGQRAQGRDRASGRALSDPRRAAHRRRFFLSRRAAAGSGGTPQDRVFSRLHHRQPHAGRGRAACCACSGACSRRVGA